MTAPIYPQLTHVETFNIPKKQSNCSPLAKKINLYFHNFVKNFNFFELFSAGTFWGIGFLAYGITMNFVGYTIVGAVLTFATIYFNLKEMQKPGPTALIV